MLQSTEQQSNVSTAEGGAAKRAALHVPSMEHYAAALMQGRLSKLLKFNSNTLSRSL